MNQFPWKYTHTNSTLSIYAKELLRDYSVSSDRPLQIDAITDTIFRIHTRTTPSFAVEQPPEPQGPLIPTETDGFLVFSTNQLSIHLDSQLHIQIFDRQGKLLCTDYTGKQKENEILSPEELEQMIQEGHVIHNGDDPCKFMIAKQLFGDEVFYGLGDKTGFLNKKGYDYTMWNTDNPDPQVENSTFKAMYKSFPFFITLRPDCVYGIFFDNHYKTFFDMGYSSTDYYSFGAADGDLDYYFIYGNNIPEVLAGYTSLTGRSPLPQMWTLGYHQSRWSYSSAEEVLTLAENFRKYNVPCDAIHLDIDYMDNFKIFTTDKHRFADLEQLSQKLKALGIKLVTIIDPGTKAEEGYYLYEDGLKNDYFAKTPDGQVYHNIVWPGDSVFPDYTSSKVRQWWGAQTSHLLRQGIRGIWNDMNEPASFQGPLPENVVFSGDHSPRLHKEVHNIYGHLMAKATYEGLKKHDKKRPFVITRACYSGSQKYATAWTGDNQSLWSHLKMSIPQLLNLGMSGMPFVGTDIGGFGSNTTPELFSRWIEASCFAPLFRNHSAKYTRRQEPWQFDQETLEINRKYITLHYKFLPYFYDLCYEESKTGIPMMRPLVMHYEKDKNTWECNDEYLVGTSILVAPVTDQGARARIVYLPEGIWVDYWTGERIHGGKNIIREAPLSVCPIYIKAESLLPVWPAVNSVPDGGSSQLILEYYPTEPVDITNTDAVCSDKKTSNVTSYIHYQDNGTDFAYEEGEYNLYEFTVDNTRNLTVNLLHNGYTKEYKEILLTIR